MSPRRFPTRPLVGIGVCVWRDGSVLLIRRGRAPGAGSWSLPGGAQKLGETAEAAARRELAEEAGVEAGRLHLAAIQDLIERDQDGRIEYHYTILDFAGPWVQGSPRAGGDALEARFVARAEWDSYGLAPALRAVLERIATVWDHPEAPGLDVITHA